MAKKDDVRGQTEDPTTADAVSRAVAVSAGAAGAADAPAPEAVSVVLVQVRGYLGVGYTVPCALCGSEVPVPVPGGVVMELRRGKHVLGVLCGGCACGAADARESCDGRIRSLRRQAQILEDSLAALDDRSWPALPEAAAHLWAPPEDEDLPF